MTTEIGLPSRHRRRAFSSRPSSEARHSASREIANKCRDYNKRRRTGSGASNRASVFSNIKVLAAEVQEVGEDPVAASVEEVAVAVDGVRGDSKTSLSTAVP